MSIEAFRVGRSYRVGLLTLVLGVLLSLASGWFEIESRLNIKQNVQKTGRTERVVVYDSQDAYLAGSMAERLFALGALFIVVGMIQIQRARSDDRLVRLEQELALLQQRAQASGNPPQ